MEGLEERRRELLRRLKAEPDRSKWSRVIARFAFDYGLRKVTVQRYYRLLEEAGLLDEDAEN